MCSTVQIKGRLQDHTIQLQDLSASVCYLLNNQQKSARPTHSGAAALHYCSDGQLDKCQMKGSESSETVQWNHGSVAAYISSVL